MRDCLTVAVDLAGLCDVLRSIEREEIEVYARDTVQPSVFAHQILNAMPYAFLDDAPLEERRARAVSLRRALPEDARDLGALDPQAIQEESANAWPRVRDADELHDALLLLGVLPVVTLSPDAIGTKGLGWDPSPDASSFPGRTQHDKHSPEDKERWFAQLEAVSYTHLTLPTTPYV